MNGKIHGPIAPDRSQFLPWVTLNLACRTQSLNRAFITECDRGDVVISVIHRDTPSGLANDDRDLSFIIQLLTFGWAD